jgi:integrase
VKTDEKLQVADPHEHWDEPSRPRCPIKSRLGYDIEVFKANGDFKSVIIVPDDTAQFVYLQTKGFNQLEDDLKDALRSYVAYLVARYHTTTLLEKFWFLNRWVLSLEAGLTPEQVLIQFTLDDDKVVRSRLISNTKEFLRFLLLHEYEGISFDVMEDFLTLHGYAGKSNAYSALFLMDEHHGPFSREEVSVLCAEVDNERHSPTLRLLLDLCLCFGLRPIQLSLLKRKDYVTDSQTGLRYLNVPRVKNFARNRRMQFSARILSERTASLIERVIKSQAMLVDNVHAQDLPIFLCSQPMSLERASNFQGGKHWQGASRRSVDYYENDAKRSYAYHRRASSLRNMLGYAEVNFPLSPRTGQRFNLHPYRFRYTLGTQAVISGCTPEEVADLLDHSSTLCVKHYFRFTHEMWEILEQATQRRLEQPHFTAAWLGEGDLKGNIYARDVYETRGFTAIGQCATESACFEEPAVACYTCKRFCPNKNAAAHLNALNSLVQRKERLLSVSTPNVLSVLDHSIAGCQAAIAYAEGQRVTLINTR